MTAACSAARARVARLLVVLGFVVGIALLPQPVHASSYVPVLPPGTESQVDPTQVPDDGPGSSPPARVDESTPPAMARLSYTGVQVGALALTGLALVAAGTAAVGVAQSRTRRGWH